MKRISYILPVLAALVTSSGCITEYTLPPAAILSESLPVIEGIIVEGETVIRLSNSFNPDDVIDDNGFGQQIGDNDWSGFGVRVEGEDGRIFQSSGRTADGAFIIFIDRLDESVRYRLVVSNETNTLAGMGPVVRYESEWRRPQSTPPVEAVKFHHPGAGHPLQVQVDVTGDTEHSGYYLWSYDETWEVRAEKMAMAYFGRYDGDYTQYSLGEAEMYAKAGTDLILYTYPNYRSPFYYGWKYEKSRKLILGNTERLSANTLRDHTIYEIDLSDDRLSNLYHTRVFQYSIGVDAYYYFENLKKNTDEAGSIFAPIPSEMQGNIVCVTSPDRTVIGFIEVSKRAEREIYLSRNESPYIKPNIFCPTILNSTDDPNYSPWSMYPIDESSYTYINCIDCRQLGATKDRPSWWPNDHY